MKLACGFDSREAISHSGLFLSCLVFCTVVVLQVHAEELEFEKGTVAEVIDGDTISFCPKTEEECKSQERYEVDLWGIDAPEMLPRKQFHAEKAKDYLESVVESQIVILEIKETDESGKKLAKLFVVGSEPSNLNVHLLMEGHAWSIVEDESDAFEYDLAEEYAKGRKLGLWREVEPVSPWEWRKQEGDSSDTSESPEEDSAS